ncbi:MAG: hypothetical protein AAFZ01_11550 [Pseudomonadota bacterium]
MSFPKAKSSDAIVGLRFELSGGLGRMSGHVVGTVQDLYLVQREGDDHLELLELSDLRAARFFQTDQRARTAIGDNPTAQSSPQASTTPPSAPAASSARGNRLSDRIRNAATETPIGDG